MADINRIDVLIATASGSGSGTDGNVYIGVAGREFYIDSAQDDFEGIGRWGSDVYGHEERISGLGPSGVASGDLLPPVRQCGRGHTFLLAEVADRQAAGLPAGETLSPEPFAGRIGHTGWHGCILNRDCTQRNQPCNTGFTGWLRSN